MALRETSGIANENRSHVRSLKSARQPEFALVAHDYRSQQNECIFLVTSDRSAFTLRPPIQRAAYYRKARSLMNETNTLPLSRRLKEATTSTHETLDQSIMSRNMFATTKGYRDFVLLQYRFHQHLDPLYRHEVLAGIIPDLTARNRFSMLQEDLNDLGEPLPAPQTFLPVEDASVAAGWLYVGEGSKLGAGFLIKLAQKIGFTPSFGARHLAPDPEGRGLSWNRFREAIDHAPELDPTRCIQGAQNAFRHVRRYLESPEDVLMHP
ncbi:biliverdin-producing heme oxygenase [Gluconobacter potus]|uniref:biliverdin-producing heme oxygenase n=2 Tax=Gluconobacter potus TaxID=2724927 RepID=UPI0039EA78DB